MKVSDFAIELIKKEKVEYIGYETYGYLDEIYFKAKEVGVIRGFKPTSQLRNHPLNRHQVILNALDRDDRFEKFYIICTNGRAEVLVRMFKLKSLTKSHK